MNRQERKKIWVKKWKIEIAIQKHKNYMISKRKPHRASKEFKNFIKEFYKKNKRNKRNKRNK